EPDDQECAAAVRVVDLGMLRVCVLDLEALDQGIAYRGVLDDTAHLGQVGFGVQRRHRALKALPVVRRAEVVEARRRACAVLEFVCGERHRANLSCTARLRRRRTAARSSVLTRLVSAGSAAAMSSKATTRASGT